MSNAGPQCLLFVMLFVLPPSAALKWIQPRNFDLQPHSQGKATPVSARRLAGIAAKFLWPPASREFFLCVPGPLSEKQMALMTKSPASNARRPEDRNLGPMWPVTQRLLQDFYRPFNARLAQVLADKAFAWRKT